MSTKDVLAQTVFLLLVAASLFVCVGAFAMFGRAGFFVVALVCFSWAVLFAYARKSEVMRK